jgi:hypothetical protein
MFSLKFSIHFHRFRKLSCKSLKTPKKQPEAGSRRKTHNTMTKRKQHKDKQRSTKHYTENKYRAARTQLQTGGGLVCSGKNQYILQQ